MEDIAENEVTIGGELQLGTFSIKESAKAFSILSSSLYKNKIRAIIRELSCNARDSRVAAGFDENFYVHLPTRMEPEFWIKDEGLGLSHDDVMKLYTTYFESTKTTSNKFVGALGLGSKSPFSYTENFTITAIKDGSRGVYSAFINEIGVPSIVCLFTGPTEEPNGVEVRIPVAAKDHSTFSTEAVYVYNWFDVRPATNITLYYTYATKETYKEYYSSNNSTNSIVLMGGVSYDFDMKEFIPTAVDIKFLFRVGIGDVDVLPSREGLQNTAKTKAVIASLYNRIIDLEETRIGAEFDKLTTDYEKLSYLNEHDDILCNTVKLKIKNKTKFNRLTVSFDLSNYNLKCSKAGNFYRSKSLKHIIRDNFSPSSNVKIIYNDIGAANVRVREQLKNSSDNILYIFTKIDSKLDFDFEAFQKDVLMGAEVILASSFYVKPVREYVSSGVRKKLGVMLPVYGRSSYRLVSCDIFHKENLLYYVKLEASGRILYHGKEISVTSIVNFFGASSVIFIKNTSKYDVTGLVNFFDHVDSLRTTTSKYIVNDIELDFTNLLDMIVDQKIRADDLELNDLALEYSDYNKSISSTTKKLRNFINTNYLYSLDTRIPYDQTIIEKLNSKYNFVKVSADICPQLVEKLINTIHNHEKV